MLFLSERFRNPPGLLAFLNAYDAPMPKPATVDKWFQRASVPSEWLVVLLAYLEIDNGAPISLVRYLNRGPTDAA